MFGVQIQNQSPIISMKSLKDGEYEYRETDFLGEGSFAKVYRGVIVKTQRVIAVRLLSLKLIKQYGNKIKAIINGEVSVLKELSETTDADCLFTTRIYDCFLTEHNVVMILEFCPDGNLEDIVSKQGPVPEAQALEIAYQLARGLQFISKRKVVHRDIKPDNIFIKKDSGYTLYKLGDFGFAVKKQINQDIVGTPIFMSPQLFREDSYGSEVDVWAYGLLVHYILFKEHYFMESSEQKVKQKVLNTRYQLTQKHMAAISPLTAQFLCGCLQFEKAKRLKPQNLANHPIFDKVRDKTEVMVKQVSRANDITESQLRKRTAKGQYMSYVMSFKFISDFAVYLGKKNSSNLATLYLLKYCLSELSRVKREVDQRSNVIGHPQWECFIKSNEFANSFKLVDVILAQVQSGFEYYYTRVMGMISQQYPQVAQGIASNLGNSPFAPISVEIPIYELKNNWLSTLGNSPQQYFTKIQIHVVICLLQKRVLDLDFSAVEIMKKSATIEEMLGMFEQALKGVAGSSA